MVTKGVKGVKGKKLTEADFAKPLCLNISYVLKFNWWRLSLKGCKGI